MPLVLWITEAAAIASGEFLGDTYLVVWGYCYSLLI